MFNIFYIVSLHYFFLKITKISDFVKSTTFDQGCKFPWNEWSSFDEKWALHTRKLLDVNTYIQKFTEENIVFT